MKLQAVDVVALSTYVIGGGLSGVCAFAAVVDPKHAAIYAAGGGMLISVAGIVRIFANKTGAPATSIVPDAPIVRPNGVPTGAVNISNTSTTPITAPQKGP